MPLTVKQADAAKAGRHADGSGLYLVVKPSGTRSWVLRVQADGQRRDIGLGGYVEKAVDGAEHIPLLHRRILSIREAREKAQLLRLVAKAGGNPVEERDRDRKAPPTFDKATDACHKARGSGWSQRTSDAFLASLKEHAYPRLGDLRVDHIESAHVIAALAPIWKTTPVMASKVRQRIGTVLSYAKSQGWRKDEAPGKSVLAGLSAQTKGGNFSAMPYADVPAFVADIAAKADSAGRSALLFAILTAARSGEVRSAMWSHIDLDKRTWTRPAHLMKSRTAHVVTLNDPAVALLKRLSAERLLKIDGLVFAGKGNRPLSDMTLTKVMRDADQPYTVHGFRSSFRDWAAEKMPTIPDPVAEASLAHAVSDKVVAAYKRTTFLEMRRDLLAAWGRFVAGGGIADSGHLGTGE